MLPREHDDHCLLNPGQGCLNDDGCPSGDVCSATGLQVAQFALHLTAGQPIGWQLSAGLATLPLPDNAGSIPPAPEDPFIGVLRCVAIDPNGMPTDRDVLQGEATVEQYEAASPLLDAATYNAVGIAALPGAGGDDGQLEIGGPTAEYEGCPAVLTLNHFFDHAIDPLTGATQIETTLALIPCAADVSRGVPDFSQSPGVVLQYLVYNEFEQQFSTSRPMTVQQVTPLSLIDTTEPRRSIFSAGVAGTLSGQTRIQAFGGGVMAVALEGHRSLTAPERIASAAFNLHSQGVREEADIVTTAFGCTAHPVVGCRTANASRLRIADRQRARGDRVAWEWRKGQPTSMADFGVPLDTTAYALCIYDGSGTGVVGELIVPPSSANWVTARRGFSYADPGAAADGVRTVVLRASGVDRARVALRATGAQVPPLPLASALQPPVVVQLVNSDTGACFESVFDAAAVARSAPATFEGRAPASP